MAEVQDSPEREKRRSPEPTTASIKEDRHEISIKDASKRPRLAMDPGLEKRTRRFMGVLKGTLNQFIKDTSQKSEAEKKREQIDQRLAEKLRKEKEVLSEKVKQEAEERQHRRQQERSAADAQRAAQANAYILDQKTNLSNFVLTTTKPPITFLPANHTEKTRELLAEHKRISAIKINEWKARVEKEEEERNQAAEPDAAPNLEASTEGVEPMDIDDEHKDKFEVAEPNDKALKTSASNKSNETAATGAHDT
ncbi:pinin/SDK/memA/ protein conserved region-domain-containing protein [Phlyctochytrium arcticum]|nr:pinin/SDK/memA/ protein conserved region-domain-containing protein [Phlyctochytrium arcticum]